MATHISEAYELLEENNSPTTSYDATRPDSSAARTKPYVPLTGRRLLLFSVGIVLLYLVSGVVIYTVGSGMTVLDAVYFSIVTLTTVGYGDLNAHTAATKLFTCVYILVGVAMIGALLARLVEMLLDEQEEALMDMIKHRTPRKQRWGGSREEFLSGPWGVLNRSFHSLRDVNPYHVKVWSGIAWFVVLTTAGALMFQFTMDISFVDAIYFTVVSAATVGYGDISPSSTTTKVFAIFYLPLSTLLLAKVISDYAEMTVEANNRKKHEQVLLSTMSEKEFKEMDANDDGRIDKWEYLVRQLMRQGKLSKEEVDNVWEHFHALDTDNSGFLEFDEVSAERDENKDGMIDIHEIKTARRRESRMRKRGVNQ